MKKTSPAGKPTKKSPAKKSSKRITATKKASPYPVKDHVLFPVVGIGASAGGLEAVTELLKHITANTGMAFIFVQHLSPDHQSLLSSLLTNVSKIPVQEATNGIKIEPDNLFIIPPDKEMKVKDGRIMLAPRLSKNKVNLLIDVFFTSLAEQFHEKVIGVILSGSATDGTNGMRLIKDRGGVTFAQDDSARFNSMPKSAVAAGVVDFVLSPAQIAAELIRISKHPYIRSGLQKTDLKTDDIDNNNPDLKSILHLLRQTFGVNFSLYKVNTIKRRIMRRMLLSRIKSLKAYAIWLRDKRSEQEVLFNDLLINVTNFFRDEEACKHLKSTLFPRLLKDKKGGEALRIWITACSTGEEAYSIAMLLLEIQEGGRFKNVPIQIFATDLSKQAISKARIGVYTKQETDHVSPKQLQNFFTRYEGGYRISQRVRDMCVFAPHNILNDPPFSRVDFISCCNLLIYFDPVAQKKVLSTFHYALNRDGYLMLGKSETTASAAQLFTPVDKKLKLYSRKKNSGSGMLPRPETRFSRAGYAVEDIAEVKSEIMKSTTNSTELDTAVNSLLLSKYVPSSVVINQQMEIIQFRGNTSLYLQHPEGKASLNIMKMARAEIAFELRNAITKAFKTKKPVLKKGIEMNGGDMLVSLEATPLNMQHDEPALLVVFTKLEMEEAGHGAGTKKSASGADVKRITRMEEEIAAYREDLLSISHNHEAAMEELQSANEEVLSSNEELRSINEELETSKEEIQSANEELATTNQELQTRNELLNESYKYSEAIISTIHDPMVILDKDLRIKTANRSFYQRFYLTEEDTEGMSFYDIAARKWNIPKLRELMNGINSGNSGFKDLEIEQTFPRTGRVIMRLNAKRIVQHAHREQLILLAIADITEVTKRQRTERQKLEQEVDSQTKQSHAFENAVTQRTKELKQANEELAAANSELKKANKELESFAYISSHDLQEPLRKIQLYVSRILSKENDNLTEKGKEYFEKVLQSAVRMQALIEDLLMFARINTSEIQPEKADLHKITVAVKNELKEVIHEKGATVEIKDLCSAHVIPFQFHQLMQNLISNALKFTEVGRPPVIVIESRIEKGRELGHPDLLPDSNYCHVRVTDNGIGFEQEFSEQIFEVFQRLHGQREYPGTGIGLAIAKKIVENHRGIISATSEVGKGTRFDIYLPD